MTQTERNLLYFIRIACGSQIPKSVSGTDWSEAMELAKKQGITGIILDGINRCFEKNNHSWQVI